MCWYRVAPHSRQCIVGPQSRQRPHLLSGPCAHSCKGQMTTGCTTWRHPRLLRPSQAEDDGRPGRASDPAMRVAAREDACQTGNLFYQSHAEVAKTPTGGRPGRYTYIEHWARSCVKDDWRRASRHRQPRTLFRQHRGVNCTLHVHILFSHAPP